MSKRPGTSYQIKIHFSIKTTKFLVKYNLLSFQIFDRLKISFTKHDYKVSKSFMQENKRYKGLKTGKWISIRSLVPGLLLTVRSASVYTCRDLDNHPFPANVPSNLSYKQALAVRKLLFLKIVRLYQILNRKR